MLCLFLVQCWTVESQLIKDARCFSNNTVRVRDCLSMASSTGSPVYWFGGAEMISQQWPINGLNLQNPTAFLSSDLPLRHGNVLERYYLSSLGVALYVDPSVPLYVSIIPNKQICLESTYDPSGRQHFVGPGYLKPLNETNRVQLRLSYVVCVGDSVAAVHQTMTNLNNGVIKRPSQLPDLKMMQDPIWSTWARQVV